MSKDLTFRKKLNDGKDDNWDEFTSNIFDVTINKIDVTKVTDFEKVLTVRDVRNDYDAKEIIDFFEKYGWKLIRIVPGKQPKLKINYHFVGKNRNRRRSNRRPRF